jgi:hypothetical protein
MVTRYGRPCGADLFERFLLMAMLANQRLSIRSKDDATRPAAATCEYASTHVL